MVVMVISTVQTSAARTPNQSPHQQQSTRFGSKHTQNGFLSRPRRNKKRGACTARRVACLILAATGLHIVDKQLRNRCGRARNGNIHSVARNVGLLRISNNHQTDSNRTAVVSKRKKIHWQASLQSLLVKVLATPFARSLKAQVRVRSDMRSFRCSIAPLCASSSIQTDTTLVFALMVRERRSQAGSPSLSVSIDDNTTGNP